jgi:hypothetical protein
MNTRMLDILDCVKGRSRGDYHLVIYMTVGIHIKVLHCVARCLLSLSHSEACDAHSYH